MSNENTGRPGKFFQIDRRDTRRTELSRLNSTRAETAQAKDRPALTGRGTLRDALIPPTTRMD